MIFGKLVKGWGEVGVMSYFSIMGIPFFWGGEGGDVMVSIGIPFFWGGVLNFFRFGRRVI